MRRMMKYVADAKWKLVFAVVLVAAVSGLVVVMTSTQDVRAAPKPRIVKDVTFGKGGNHELKLDLAMPEGEGPFPALLCVHGGGWVRGRRSQMEQTIHALAEQGYVAVTIDYRLAPGARFPAQVEDCKLAVRWLRAHAKEQKIDPNRIGVLGFSAGAYLACMVGLTTKEDGFDGVGGHLNQSSQVRAVVCFSPPTDLTYQGWSELVKKDNLQPLLGGTYQQKRELYEKASPIRYVRKGAPAFLVFHGNEDAVVPLQQSQAFVKKLQSKGASAKLISVAGEKHVWKGDKLVTSLKQMMRFLDKELKR